jgi:adenosylhomocysteinase
MDLSFAAQALALQWLASGQADLPAGVHPVPGRIDAQVAGLTLAALGARIDELTTAQQEYLASWQQGS